MDDAERSNRVTVLLDYLDHVLATHNWILYHNQWLLLQFFYVTARTFYAGFQLTLLSGLPGKREN